MKCVATRDNNPPSMKYLYNCSSVDVSSFVSVSIIHASVFLLFFCFRAEGDRGGFEALAIVVMAGRALRLRPRLGLPSPATCAAASSTHCGAFTCAAASCTHLAASNCEASAPAKSPGLENS